MNNNQLCQQLEEAQSTSNRLMEDVHQLTARWNKSQLTLREKEAHWQESFEVGGSRRERERERGCMQCGIALMCCLGSFILLAEVTPAHNKW